MNRRDFQKCVEGTKAERHARGFGSWDQAVALLFCQLARAQSLREICDGLLSCEGKLYHLGLGGAPSRATLAYANKHRPQEMFQQLFEKTYERVSNDLAQRGKLARKFKFKHKVYSIDSTVIDLCLSMFDWAKFCHTKGAVKLHLKLDHDGCLPSFAVLSEGNVADITVARTWKFEPGAIVVFDRGYCDYPWFGQLHRDGVFFVTRLKSNAVYQTVDESRQLMRWEIVSDDVITMAGVQNKDGSLVRLRRVEVEDPETGQIYEFLTNNHKLAAGHHRRYLPPALADRALLQNPQDAPEDQELPGHLAQRGLDADLDSTDRHPPAPVPAAAFPDRLVDVQHDRHGPL